MTDYVGSRIPHELRIPCSCGSTQGSVQTVRFSNGTLHKEVACDDCRQVHYAKKGEVDEAKRVKFAMSVRAYVRERAANVCEIPEGEHAGGFHIGHIIGLNYGLKHNIPVSQLNHPTNLMWCCRGHNLAMGVRSLIDRPDLIAKMGEYRQVPDLPSARPADAQELIETWKAAGTPKIAIAPGETVMDLEVYLTAVHVRHYPARIQAIREALEP